jgi:hypothetical protein
VRHLALGERRPDLIVRFGYAEAMPFSLAAGMEAAGAHT